MNLPFNRTIIDQGVGEIHTGTDVVRQLREDFGDQLIQFILGTYVLLKTILIDGIKYHCDSGLVESDLHPGFLEEDYQIIPCYIDDTISIWYLPDDTFCIVHQLHYRCGMDRIVVFTHGFLKDLFFGLVIIGETIHDGLIHRQRSGFFDGILHFLMLILIGLREMIHIFINTCIVHGFDNLRGSYFRCDRGRGQSDIFL